MEGVVLASILLGGLVRGGRVDGRGRGEHGGVQGDDGGLGRGTLGPVHDVPERRPAGGPAPGEDLVRERGTFKGTIEWKGVFSLLKYIMSRLGHANNRCAVALPPGDPLRVEAGGFG